MIRLTRLNLVPLVINSDLIEYMETTPDTVIAMTNGQKFLVRETPDEVIEHVIEFRRSVLSRMPAYAWPARNHSPVSPAIGAVRQVADGE